VLKYRDFRHHGNKGRSGVKFNDTVKLHDLTNPLFAARFSAISRVIAHFVLKFPNFRY